MLSKEQIVAYRPKPTRIEVPELGEVFVRLLTEAEAIAAGDKAGEDNTARAKFVRQSLCDGEGKRVFEDGELDKVLELPFSAVLSIFTQGMKLNYPEVLEDGKEKN